MLQFFSQAYIYADIYWTSTTEAAAHIFVYRIFLGFINLKAANLNQPVTVELDMFISNIHDDHF